MSRRSLPPPPIKGPPPTQRSKWRLRVEEGRQVWEYVRGEAARLQSMVEKYALGEDISLEAPPLPTPNTPLEAASNGVKFYEKLQCEDGHWANDYGGPLFLMPGLVITCYTTGTELTPEQKAEMIYYIKNMQREDGGWGLHIESPSTIFGTAMNYVALRLLGVEKDEEVVVQGRKFLHANGGAKGIPSWGKFWLATLGVYDWEGLAPIPPELWLLPYWVPFHPGRWWCHCRVVYLPMGYIYGRRATAKETPLIRALREELYSEPYDSIPWRRLRLHVSPLDMYTPHTKLLRFTFAVVGMYEKRHNKALRRRALELTLDHIRSEDRNTKWIDIGPVNKVLNMLAVWHAEGSQSEHFRRHQERIVDYLWLAKDGMKMQGYNGSQLWDTAFSLQAIIETGLGPQFATCLKQGHHYLDVCQVREDVPEHKKYYRHISKGAWPFSTRDHGWPISDCTAEGLKACLLLRQFAFIERPLEPQRLFEAVNVILSFQNRDSGGWATYELKRAPAALELLNPAEVFHGIMVDYPYVECSSACVQALAMFHEHFPHHRADEVRSAIRRGAQFIKSIQRPDGSWIGSWGVCFTYGTWFGVEGLIAAGEPQSSPHIRKACEFLISKQKEDGGWGETFDSCVTHDYSDNPQSQVVNTAWAVLTLLRAGYHRKPIERGIKLLMQRQLPNGDWAQEAISGVFNANCAITYAGYKNIFPIWALGRFAKVYASPALGKL